jgi:nucleoside-diphosphate-sugar epimerase
VRVLVTGAAGFVGGRLVPALDLAGHEVYALDRDAARVAGLPAVPVEHDLTTPIEPGRLPAVDAVVHLAQANVPLPEGAPSLLRVNAASTVDLLDHCRRSAAARFLYASTASVYGPGERSFSEDAPLAGRDLYAVTKIAGEQLVGCYRVHFGTCILRLVAPYGPGQEARMIPRLIARVQGGEPVSLSPGGRPRMNPIHVDDAVRVLVAALELEGHHVLNVAGDEVVSIRELAELIGEAAGREPVFEEAAGGAAGDFVADTTRLHELFSIRPLIPLRDGLREAAMRYHSA